MFAEEDHLSYYMNLKKYTVIFNDNLKVKHLSSNSLNSFENIYDKMRFKSKHLFLAKRKYIKFIKKIKSCNSDNNLLEVNFFNRGR